MSIEADKLQFRRANPLRGARLCKPAGSTLAAVLIAATTAAWMAPVASVDAKQCKPNAITSATFTRKYAWQAKGDAKDDWRKKAKAAWGPSWDNWLKAADKELICWGPNKQASCYAKARPCD